MADTESQRPPPNKGLTSALKGLFRPFSSTPDDTKLWADVEEGMSDDEEPEPGNLEDDQPTILLPRRRFSLRSILFKITIVLVLFIFLYYLKYLPFPSTSPRPSSPHPRPRVDLNYTIYEGDALPSGINRFLGMRYAAPPLGSLRFRAPIEPFPSPRSVIKQATRFRALCLSTGRGWPYGDQDEDCLFVNVWAPSQPTTKELLPVWVFISGGGYNSLSNANWNGEGVVNKSGGKIVFVNFNYRVGMWGFLASERLREDGDLNAGLLDQRMVLKWVKRHIAKFGGDADRVVIHGASAGAGSVAMHMIAYGGRNDNLFAGVMSESVFFPAQRPVAEVEYQFDRVLRYTGCDQVSEEDQLACLRSQDVMLLQAANHAQPFPGRHGPPNPLFYWTPCIDGDLLQDLPYLMFEDGRFVDVPLLAGTATDEGSVFAPNARSEEDVANFFANNYPNLSPRETDLILKMYPKLDALPRHAEWYPTTSRAYGEATFICPNVNIMNVLSGATSSLVEGKDRRRRTPHEHSQTPLRPSTDGVSEGNNTSLLSSQTAVNPRRLFAYRYNVQDDDNLAWGLGVPHIFDAPAIFGPGNCPTPRSYWTYNAPIVPVFMSYHISFVRSLDPNTYRELGSPVWETWGGGRGDLVSGGHGHDDVYKDEDRRDTSEVGKPTMRRLVVETGNTRMEQVSGDELRRCEFWLGLGDILEQL
ncbi:alpha/beta-hydrolase [Rhypophila sp. PSN 637]